MTVETPGEPEEPQPTPETGSAPQPPAEPAGELEGDVLGTDTDEQAETGADSMADAARQAESEGLPQPD